MVMTSTVVKIATPKYPKPTTIPIAATTQMVAAVVKPLTSDPVRRMAPAPRKPTPVTICAAMRVGSTRLPKMGSRPTVVNRHAPTPTSAIVRMPAGWPWYSRSEPMKIARMRVTTIRRAKSRSPLSGRGSAPARAPAGFVLGLRLIGELRKVKAVNEVAEHGQPLVVDRGVRLVLLVGRFVGLRDDAGGVHDFGRDEDGALHAHRQ